MHASMNQYVTLDSLGQMQACKDLLRGIKAYDGDSFA